MRDLFKNLKSLPALTAQVTEHADEIVTGLYLVASAILVLALVVLVVRR